MRSIRPHTPARNRSRAPQRRLIDHATIRQAGETSINVARVHGLAESSDRESIPVGAGGQGEKEGGAKPFLTHHPDASAVPLYNALANRQTDAGTRILRAVQALKYAEDLLGIFRIDADSIIPDRNEPPASLAFCRDVDLGDGTRLSVLQPIPDQILKELDKL